MKDYYKTVVLNKVGKIIRINLKYGVNIVLPVLDKIKSEVIIADFFQQSLTSGFSARR